MCTKVYELSIKFLIFAVFKQMFKQMFNQMQDNETNLKSEALTPDEREELKNFVEQCPTKAIAANRLGMSRGTLDRIIGLGSGAPDSIKSIRKQVQMYAVSQ